MIFIESGFVSRTNPETSCHYGLGCLLFEHRSLPLPKKQRTMEIVTIEKKTFERMMETFNALSEKVAYLQCKAGNGKETAWMTGEEVCVQLRICPRTLQSYRDRRLIGFSQINRKFYYRPEEVSRFMSLVGTLPTDDKQDNL